MESLTDSMIVMGLFWAAVSLLLLVSLNQFRRVRALKHNLAQEKNKQNVPVLKLSIDENTLDFCLRNDSSCGAKDIVIENLSLTMKYEFVKVLMLKFDNIPILNSGEQAVIKFRAYDGEFEMHGIDPKNLTTHLLGGKFEMILHFQNFRGILFRQALIKVPGQNILQEVLPVEDDPKAKKNPAA